jgi:hypothetical protein
LTDPHRWLIVPLRNRLKKLRPEEPYDLIFIDAQKSGYPTYLSTILAKSPSGGGSGPRLLRAGGLIVADNALQRGLVADPSDDNPWAAVRRAEYESAAAAEGKGGAASVAPAVPAQDLRVHGVRGYGKSEYARSDDLRFLDDFNRALGASDRLESLMLPLWDGLALARLLD